MTAEELEYVRLTIKLHGMIRRSETGTPQAKEVYGDLEYLDSRFDEDQIMQMNQISEWLQDLFPYPPKTS